MSWLVIWFIVELIGVGAAPDLREPQALKNVFLRMMIDKTYFLSYISSKLAPHSSF